MALLWTDRRVLFIMQRFVNPHMSGCPCRTIGSVQSLHRTSTLAKIEKSERGKIKDYHPLDLRRALEQRKTERVFEPTHCPPELVKAVLAQTKEASIQSVITMKVPIRPGWVKEMTKPENGNMHFFCVPTLSIHCVREVCSHMFGDTSGMLKDEDAELRAGHVNPVWKWWIISGNTKPTPSGNLSLADAVISHLVYRRTTGKNLFNSSRLVSIDKYGRRVVLAIDPRDGRVSIPKCDCPPERGDSHIHGVFLPK